MNALGQLACICGISALAAVTTRLIKGPERTIIACDPSLLKSDEVCLQQLAGKQNLLWVDARSRQQWQESGMPGSVLWNLDSSENMQTFEAELIPRLMDMPHVIVYCGDENCGISRQVAVRIRALDLGVNVSVLKGGWRALKNAGAIKDSNLTP